MSIDSSKNQPQIKSLHSDSYYCPQAEEVTHPSSGALFLKIYFPPIEKGEKGEGKLRMSLTNSVPTQNLLGPEIEIKGFNSYLIFL